MDPDLLVALDEDGDLDDFLVFNLLDHAEKRQLPRLNFAAIGEDECWEKFRFRKEDIPRLQQCLHIPDNITCSTGVKENGTNALLLLLRRLAYPNRYCDLLEVFGRSPSELSLIFNTTLDHVYDNFSYLLSDINELFWLSEDNLHLFADSITDKGAPLQNCWGFVDGTVRPIARPSLHQEVAFNGHHRIHGLKFQSLMTPIGLHAHMWGPLEGRRHDVIMLRESGLLNQLENLPLAENGQPFVIYGDPAYPVRQHIISPFKGANRTPLQADFNAAMSRVRQCVEWGFRDVVANFAFCDFRKNQKVLLQPVAKYFIVATILSNCKTCLYSNITSDFFALQPPTLEQYTSNTR